MAQSPAKNEEDLRRLAQAFREAETVIVGAGAGLSTSAGFVYDGERFRKNFSDFIVEYSFEDMYSAGFYEFKTPEERWAFWSRYIYINRYANPPKPVYGDLYELIRDKDYFVITTNVDHCFQKAGFDKARLFYTQGDYGLFQCSGPCCDVTYDNEATVLRMVREQRNRRVPSELIPVCPRCGRPMVPNLRADDSFVQDAGWYAAAERYCAFLERAEGTKALFLELGVGFNTPAIIKFPFWRFTNTWPDATFACINLGRAFAPEKIREKSVCIDADIGKVLKQLLQMAENSV